MPETKRTSRELGPRILEALRVNEEMTVIGIRRALGLDDKKGWTLVNNALRELVKTGCAEKTGKAKYKYLKEPVDDAYLKTQKRMVRIIRIRTKKQEPFTAKILSELSDCSFGWAGRYIKHLVDNGIIERAGYIRQHTRGARAPAYLADEDRLNDNWPALRRRKGTAELDSIMSDLREKAHRIAGFAKPDLESLKEVIDNASEIIALADKAREKVQKNARS